jgi:hypothetical protein
MTDEQFEDVSSEELIVDYEDSSLNDTNDAILAYFARMSNHYLRLANTSSLPNGSSRHLMKFPIIADSGASCHMFKEKEFFRSLTPSNGSVLLGDGKTRLQIEGVGTVQCMIDNDLLVIPNVRYVPSLGESIYSLLTHIKQQNHGLHSTSDQGLFIIFPNFKTRAIIGDHDIYLDAIPVDYITCNSDSLCSDTASSMLGVTKLQNEIDSDSRKLDNLLVDLRKYYDFVRTKRQLRMEVPAGFRSLTKSQRQFTSGFLENSKNYSLDNSAWSDDDTFLHHISSDDDTVLTSNLSQSPDISTSSMYIPITRAVDKPSSSLPSVMKLSEDFIQSCVGFRKIDTMKRHFITLYKDSVVLDNTPANVRISTG